MEDEGFEAILALRGGGYGAVGRQRINLLEAVGVHGSISKAAQSVGISYKSAWEALNAINNLLPRPVVVTQSGGRHGGGAEITPDGRNLIAAFNLIERRLGHIANAMTQPGEDPELPGLVRRIGLRTTARNAFRCTVTMVRGGSVNAEIGLEVSPSCHLTALVTRDSARDLDLVPGGAVTALVPSSVVVLAEGTAEPRISTRNRLFGVVRRRDDGPVSSAVMVDLGEGKTLAALVTRAAVADLRLDPEAPVWAMFKASHVVIATD